MSAVDTLSPAITGVNTHKKQTQEEQDLDLEFAFLSRSFQREYLLQQGAKRLMDFLLAVMLIQALLPVFLIISLLIKMTSPGPVIYKSLRIGKHNEPFHMYKFRTMHVDADAQRDALRQQANLQGNLFKIKNDPRVTRFGAFLRACSLDELPQLINVIQGNMSLVGPRPLPPDESILFESPYNMRFLVKPGITGLWQIKGRSNLGFQDLCQLELNYLLGWSILMDMWILLQTFPAVLKTRGAY